MKTIIVTFFFMGVFSTFAQEIILKGADADIITTGERLEGVRNSVLSVHSCEISDLVISAYSGNTNQVINTTSSSFGINTDKIADETDAFEAGEKITLAFGKDIRINQIDFNRLGSNETFTVNVAGSTNIVVHYNSLTNKNRGYFNASINLPAETEIEFYTTGGSIVGLDGISITVLEPSLSICCTNGEAQVSARFDKPALSDFVLQYTESLSESNGWDTLSQPFSDDNSWDVSFSNTTGFYRTAVNTL